VWDSLHSSGATTQLFAHTVTFLEVPKILAKLLTQLKGRSDSKHRKAFRFAQACTRGNPQHWPTQNTVSQQSLVLNDVKSTTLGTFVPWQVTLFCILRRGLQYFKRF